MPARNRASVLGVVAGLAAAGVAACGGGGDPSPAAAARPPARVAPPARVIAPAGGGTSCADIQAATLAGVARRVYADAAHGPNVRSAVRRLARSRALSAAVAAGDAARVRAVVVPLLKHQIRRLRIVRGGRVLVDVRGARALAPVRGVVRGPDGRVAGRYVLSVAQDLPVAGLIRGVTGADVVVRTGGPAPVPRAAASERVLEGEAYPGGPLWLQLRLPPTDPGACAATPAATAAATIGRVGERLLGLEGSGAAVHRVLRHVAADRAFVRAVRRDDPALMRREVIRFFRTRSLHVVRVRATTPAGRLVADIGGPYVLQPATATLRTRTGAPAGRVTLAVQDDTGYIKLLHRVTGADVLLRTPAGQVPGSSLRPGPATVPPDGTVTWRGHTYATQVLAAHTFPSGPLTVDLLIPAHEVA